jgi:peptide/nickel transport system ATP-binding protein
MIEMAEERSAPLAEASNQPAVLQVDQATKIYKRRHGGGIVRAVNRVSFTVEEGKVLGLVGESGSGKSTIARLVTGVEKRNYGHISLNGLAVESLTRRELRAYRKDVQMIFQDPYAALNPQNTVGYDIMRPVINYLHLPDADARTRAYQILEMVRLSPASLFFDKRPHELSGGQRQRVVIARALAPEPRLVVADEPVSMLDVSVRAEILELLQQLRLQNNLSMIYITHDLLSARILADRLLVLYSGKAVESGPTLEVILHPQHPYTQLLLASVPNPYHENHERPSRAALNTSVPQVGCQFAPRCPFIMERCHTDNPALFGEGEHKVACFLHHDRVEVPFASEAGSG